MTPDEHTISESWLDVGDGHQLYVHEWGNPAATAVIIHLHGGPGSSAQNKHRGVYNPETQRVIFFDQRGCGKSTPYGSLEHNTTPDLIEDIEKIAGHFSLKDFILSGSSWGSSLALAYALKYPGRVTALVLSGIWTCSTAEIDWLDKGRFATFFPDVWEQYVQTVPPAQQANPSSYHFPRALGDNPEEAKAAAFAYSNLEGAVLSLDDRFNQGDYETFDPSGTIIEMHYLQNRCFMPDRFILDNAHQLTMPVWLIQGRYDMVCPPNTAYELAQKLPFGKLLWTINGHKNEHESWNLIRTILGQLSEATQ